MKHRTLDYRQRIDRVLDHIAGHPEDDLSVERLAGIACFSQFHFHRLFHALVGEPVNGHVRRVRLERAEAERHGLSLRGFEPCSAATVRCTGDLSKVDHAWQALYNVWLPQSGDEPLDLPALELFVRIPEEIGWETFDLECVIAVRR